MKLSKNMFYILRSNMQKAIRRSRTDIAVRSAEHLYRDNPWMTFSRLIIIVFEDCGRDHDLVRFTDEFYSKKRTYKNWDDVKELVIRCSEGVKTRDVNLLSLILDGGYFKDIINPADFLTPMFGKQFVSDLEESSDYAFRQKYPERSKDLSWIKRVRDKEMQGRSYPYWYFLDDGKTPEAVRDEAPEKFDRVVSDLILCSAVDQHTRAGKMALRALIKKCPIRTTDRAWSIAEFFACSGLLNHANSGEFAMEVFMHYPEVVLDLMEWILDNMSIVLDLKEWALKKSVDLTELNSLDEASSLPLFEGAV